MSINQLACEGWQDVKDTLEKDYCEICKKETNHHEVLGHKGIESYLYWTCIECGEDG